MKKLMIIVAVLAAIFLITAGSCSAGKTSAQDAAASKAASHQVYIPTHDVEFNNYNNRQKIADNPSTIIWCTFAYPIPSSPLITVPIVGKLTSGTKRPYATEIVDGNKDSYYPELPGPDGMYGASDPNYRYGFTPGGNYWDFTGLSMACTDQPTVYQRDSTTIVMQADPTLGQAQKQAQAALAAGNNNQAQQILQQAINSVQSGK